MANGILLLLIFVSCYLIVRRLSIKTQLDKYKNKSNSLLQTKEIQFKNFISKINFIKTKEIFLSKQGYPLKLDVIRYYAVKVGLSFTLLSAGIVNYHSVFMAVILAIFGYYFVDIYIQLNQKNRDAEIGGDVLNIINSICLQLEAQVSLKDSLKMQYENCKNKDFKKAMIEFSTCYELSELNIDEAIGKLQAQFSILELDMFCNALSEYNKTGNMIEILENLADSLSEKQLDKLRENTRTKVIYITCGVLLALLNIILLTMYPLFVSIGQGFHQIFR